MQKVFGVMHRFHVRRYHRNQANEFGRRLDLANDERVLHEDGPSAPPDTAELIVLKQRL